MNKIVLSGALVSVAILAGCSSQPATSPAPTVTITEQAIPTPTMTQPSAQEEYVNSIRSIGNPLLNSATDYQLLDMGNSVCSALDGGMTINQIINYMAEQMTASGMNSETELQAAGIIIGAAVYHLCPQYSNQI